MPNDTAPAQWDGRPENPERSGPHAFRQRHGETAGQDFPAWWSADNADWTLRGGARLTAEGMACAKYLGPCLTPSEHHQRTQAAAAASWLAAREAAGKHIEAQIDDGPDRPGEGPTAALMRRIRAEWWRRDAAAINALPPPSDAAAALAEVVRVAKREAFEEAARIAEREMRELFGDAEDWKQGWNAGLAVGVAAIRARSTEGGA